MVFYINVNLIKLKKSSFGIAERRGDGSGCIMSWNKSDPLEMEIFRARVGASVLFPFYSKLFFKKQSIDI